MFHVYVIQSKKDQSLYVGFTTDLGKRMKEHNDGLSGLTKSLAPWELIYNESFKDRGLTVKREKSLKYFGKAYGQLKRRIGLWRSKGAGCIKKFF